MTRLRLMTRRPTVLVNLRWARNDRPLTAPGPLGLGWPWLADAATNAVEARSPLQALRAPIDLLLFTLPQFLPREHRTFRERQLGRSGGTIQHGAQNLSSLNGTDWRTFN